MAQEFICTLNTLHPCNNRGYKKECELNTDTKYESVSCKYRLEATVIKEEIEESKPNASVQTFEPGTEPF